jgi:hypothetical protein
MSKRLGIAAAAAMTLFSASAHASHVFFSPVSINGIVLEDSSGFTDPSIVINVGDTVTFKTTLTGSVDGPFSFSFNAGAGSTIAIAGANLPTDATPFDVIYTVTFNQAGVFDGTVTADHIASTPDYVIPGSGQQTDSRTYAFQITVQQETASIPEPSSLLLFGAAALGAAALRRRRRA